MRRMTIAAVLLMSAAAPAAADERAGLQDRVAATLRSAGPGTRFGLVVLDDTGAEIVAIAPDDRFVPASNTKIFTTAAAFDALGDVTQPDRESGASVRIERGDVILTGHGDARLSSADDCAADCLASLADAVAAKTRRVRDVVGDDSLFPNERWSPGMSWNNIPTRSGTGVSALTLDDNELRVTVTPAAGHGPARIAMLPYYTLDNRVTTGGRTAIRLDRLPGSRTLRVEGTIAPGAAPEPLRVGIDDPADYAAWRLHALLIARGVRVTGTVTVRHRPPAPDDDPATRGGAPVARLPAPPALAQATPGPLAEDLALTNRVSQNLHAELLLRRIGRITGSGSILDGQARVSAMLTRAGVERWRYDLADGSGMSSYNRVSPRGVARFLRWTQSQRWGAAWRATLPVGGVDGTLRRRFAGTALDRRIMAKTGTLNAASALAGFMTARSGRTLIFASYANDMPADGSATAAVDAALLLIAAER
ncbi:D-alanyl-D-alanine carboxypeptidase/D-alanyl-D-alanine-endopeptidase [Sphingomonas sp. RP10(2022)]|uniref:D-alanyl-D-alanine carboxypeptidase/D-alanyl-D-alanine-endopeptidase n=1 Tax=Sphingomonas liriopis TaxID=2949094 RepID=A0A9X2KNS6_9SPHN|nr:D-alanyl-D-alanine carboxypeptidase/D-alanyl-D-alanine-endopeptidase [Sphingomonas liriopis]MCP3733959.1 D-alanyl-D-alanine carboxypeptidase/D-alanyl-D-alanine-endopeptidase [Sphingomonas liriopis]